MIDIPPRYAQDDELRHAYESGHLAGRRAEHERVRTVLDSREASASMSEAARLVLGLGIEAEPEHIRTLLAHAQLTAASPEPQVDSQATWDAAIARVTGKSAR